MTRFAPVVARALLGALFLVSGLNKLVPFMPMPPMPPEAGAFIGALVSTGYFLPFLAVIEVAAGALLIAGRFVPLALVVLAPIVVHVALFHLRLAPNVGIVAFVLAAELYLAWTHRSAYAPMLRARPIRVEERVAHALPRAA